MLGRSTLIGALVLLVPALGAAQAPDTPADHRPALVFFGNGGGNSALNDLNDAGTAKLKTGWTAGGGIGWQFSPYVAVRGTFDFAQAKGRGAANAFNGQKLDHYFYGGDLQLRYPTASGFAPYVLLGAGAVTIDNPDNASFKRFTKFAGKGGIGVEYVLPRSNVGFFTQAAAYIYKFDRNGFDKNQADLLWTAGLSYRLHY
jgi:opacity protein-like surface antigen